MAANAQWTSESRKRQEIIENRLKAFAVSVIRYCRDAYDDRLLKPCIDQGIRSATSIGANVSEGQGSVSRKEFVQYLSIAYKSAKETAYWLSLIKDLRGKDDMSLASLERENNEIIRILAVSIKTVRSSLP